MKEKKKMVSKEGKLNTNRLNEVLEVGSKILKIIYAILIILAIYTIILINKEWQILGFIFKLLKVLAPFFVGLVLAWLIDPIIKYFQKKKVSRIVTTSIVFALLITIIYLLFNWMIPVMFEQLNDFIQMLPKILNDIINWFNNIFNGLKSTEFINFDNIKLETINSVEAFISELTTSLPKTFISIVKGMFSFFGVFLLGLMIGFYLLFDFDNSKRVIFNIIPKRFRKEFISLFFEINTSLLNFVKGTAITSTLITVLCTLVFSLVGLKAPLLLGLICGITNVIPYVGPYIGAVPAIIVAFSNSTGTGILVGVLIFIIQTIEGNVIHPLVMSKAMRLHPVTILISLLIFEYFFGVIGMVIAAPVVAILKIIYIWLEEKYKIYREKKLEGQL